MAFNGTKAYFQGRDKVISDVLDKYNDLPSRTIARMLFNQYPAYFPTIEIARVAIQYRRGRTGEAHRKKLKDKRYVKPL